VTSYKRNLRRRVAEERHKAADYQELRRALLHRTANTGLVADLPLDRSHENVAASAAGDLKAAIVRQDRTSGDAGTSHASRFAI
jgi:hypothetical protein